MPDENSKNPCPICGRERFAAKDAACVACTHLLRVFGKPLGPWVKRALCARVDPEAWYPTHRGGTQRTSDAAKRICAKCPVLKECRDHALTAREQHGVWGGLDEIDRRRMFAEQGDAA